MQELYDYLVVELDELKGSLKLKDNYILYYKFDLADNMIGLYNDCIDDKNLILNKLPNGFKLDHFNYDAAEVSFQIEKHTTH